MLKHGVEQLHDEALLRLRQALDALHLLEELRRRPRTGLVADQVLDRHSKRTGEPRQLCDLDAARPTSHDPMTC
jgi:hypothetical protein